MRRTEISEGQIWLDEWTELVSEEAWATARALPLTLELVRNLAEDMVRMFAERMTSICTEALYNSTSRRGHRFLQELTAKASAWGFDVRQITNQPITPTELMVKAGFAKVTTHPIGELEEGDC